MAFIVDDIILSPFKLVHWLADKLHEAAENELTDESKIREKILELQMSHELGEISDEEFRKKETKLVHRLEAVREYKKKIKIRKE